MSRTAALTLCAALLAACGPTRPAGDGTLDALVLEGIGPGVLLPGSTVVLTGRNFVDPDAATSRLVIEGARGDDAVRLSLPLTYVSPSRLELPVDQAFLDGLGGLLTGRLEGTAVIELRSGSDVGVHRSTSAEVSVELASQLSPSLSRVIDGTTWVNQPIEVGGDGLLLGGGEGTSSARLVGCFQPEGASACGPPVDVTIPLAPKGADDALDRTFGVFPYATSVSGIGPGRFVGTVALVNRHPGGLELASNAVDASFTVMRPMISGASTTSASLGQYVEIMGGGFVGAAAQDESTVLHLVGSFQPASGAARSLDVVLVPEFVSGPRLRYVVDEDDPLGDRIDLRKETGTITGMIDVTVQKGTQKLTGTAIPVELGILPVKQVIHVRFLSSYASTLRLWGLRAADALVRARALQLMREVFRGVNIELREEAPSDFALYSTLDIAGPDPNGRGYYGYDNTTGKDVGNLRLFDRIGGVNALTQADGFSGFGGVFVESFFAFSEHPNGIVEPSETNQRFDAIFDPFRPDTDGRPLDVAELAALAPPELTDGDACPADPGDRALQVSCAVWTLGNLIASTAVHEVGHSLGLAEPYGTATTFHNSGDRPNRLMDLGVHRQFEERAVLGAGPAQFCTDEFVYLRSLMPAPEGAPAVTRASCD